MKNDDFEKQLQQQPLRPVPEPWRNQILQAARAVGVQASACPKNTLKRELQQLAGFINCSGLVRKHGARWRQCGQ